jgi:carboxyl-terminal processing protease
MTRRLQYVVVSLSTCLLALLLFGLVMGRTSAADAGGPAYRHFDVFTEVISKIKSEYVEEPNMQNVTFGAVNGLLESIDPYASYLGPDQYKQYLKSRDTVRPNVGLHLSRRFGYVSVIDAVPGSPADKLSLTTGDVIESINGVGTRDMPLAYAEMLLQGEAGSTIEMSVIRVRRSAEAQKIQLTREVIAQPAVSTKMLSGDIGYLQAASLEGGRLKQIEAKLKEISGQGARKLVLDLRNNAGGTPEDGIALANLFLDNGVITYAVGQRFPKQEAKADPTKVVWKQPVVVITNRGTAGGAELAASAILDNKRGEIVGERTYGDAAIRKALTMEDGSAVIMAVAKYYNAAGKAIQDNAVAPTLVVVDNDNDDNDDDATKPAAAPQQPEKPSEDIQLKKAVEVLNVGLQAARKSDPKIAAQNPDKIAAPPQGAPEATAPNDPGRLNIPRPKQ